jgi:hypothetical protein
MNSDPVFLPNAYQPDTGPRSRLGMSGLAAGIIGVLARRRWGRAYAITGALFALVCVVNVTSRLHDSTGHPWWRPALGEITSIASVTGFLWVIFGGVDLAAARGLAGWRAVPIHAASACVFSALHCLGMWSLRRVVCTLAGVPYGWGVAPAQVLYEFRKDVVTYAVVALIYHGIRHGIPPGWPDAAATLDAPPPPPAGNAVPTRYAIRDGARLWHVAVGDILAVSSAGNYVEFHLAGGERRLVRGTLAGVGAALGAAGFWRVHRSWLVQAAAVREMAPERSGDYRLILVDGVEVPLSRRFPDGLAALRRGGA